MPKRKAAPSERSKLANYLVGQVCWGLMSAVQAQTIAQLAVEDAEEAPNELKRLAKVGSSGQCPPCLASQLLKASLRHERQEVDDRWLLAEVSSERVAGSQAIYDCSASSGAAGCLDRE